MVLQLKLRKIGNSVGVVLPKEVLSLLKVGENDTVCVTDTADGSINLRPANAEFTNQIEVARDVINRYRNTLRELAK